jgi:PST family polysaccharide transporter
VTSPPESLTITTARAAHWRLGGAIVGAVSQLVVGVLLARLLTPADFGVTTLAFVVLGLAQPLGDFGVGSAIVQRDAVSDRHIRSAFTFSTLLGCAVAATLVVGAPIGAALMHDDRVTPVLRALSIGFAIRGPAIVADALLRRDLDFRRHVLIGTSSSVVGYGGVAVSLALLGYGVWSLVWGSLVEALLSSGAQLATTRHDMRPLLARRELGQLLGFGAGATLGSWANYVALNADYVVVGRSLGARDLGLYVRAYGLMKAPHTYAASVLSRVMFPAFARVQREPARLRRGYLLLTEVTAMIAGPSMGALAIVAPHFVSSLYGAQWSGIVRPLQILCIAGYLRALYHLGGVVAQSVGRVYAELWREAVYSVLVIAGAVIGSHYGLAGVSVGVSVAIAYMFVACSNLALSVTEATWGMYLRVQRGALLTTSATCGVALVVRLWCEGVGASSVILTLGVLAAAAVPWSAGLLWMLSRPDCEPLRQWLPSWGVRLITMVARRRETSQAE